MVVALNKIDLLPEQDRSKAIRKAQVRVGGCGDTRRCACSLVSSTMGHPPVCMLSGVVDSGSTPRAGWAQQLLRTLLRCALLLQRWAGVRLRGQPALAAPTLLQKRLGSTFNLTTFAGVTMVPVCTRAPAAEPPPAAGAAAAAPAPAGTRAAEEAAAAAAATEAAAVAGAEAAQGIDQLKAELLRLVPDAPRSCEGSFLFAVDHCFSLKGQGTVLTGTVLQVGCPPWQHAHSSSPAHAAARAFRGAPTAQQPSFCR